jgi:hypothetical protein
MNFKKINIDLVVLNFFFGLKIKLIKGDKMAQFLRYTDYGTTLVFGEAGNHHFLAMRVSSSTQT